jgi:Family of unknown function (DUF6152)
MKQIFAAAVMALAAIAAAPPALAHHSGSMYDRTKPIVLTGVVKTFAWTNPHCTLSFVVDPDGPQASEEWVVELTSPGVLTRQGWTRRTLKPGDRVEVQVAPLRDGGQVGSLMKVTLLDTGEEFTPKVG